MGKVIAIGQAVLDVVFSGNTPVKAFAGGRIANMAASLGKMGVSTEYVSECATDAPGDAVIKFLESNNVGTASVDRFTEGQSQVTTAATNGIPATPTTRRHVSTCCGRISTRAT